MGQSPIPADTNVEDSIEIEDFHRPKVKTETLFQELLEEID